MVITKKLTLQKRIRNIKKINSSSVFTPVTFTWHLFTVKTNLTEVNFRPIRWLHLRCTKVNLLLVNLLQDTHTRPTETSNIIILPQKLKLSNYYQTLILQKSALSKTTETRTIKILHHFKNNHSWLRIPK